ncbi:MAG: hypothetical protein V2I82_11875 [Halieaceae bacterium]|nr:hypothetical protein [Halieaceae bacterium]
MKRLVGFDLTGWRDLAVRNWLERPGEEADEGGQHIISGGLGGVVVHVREGAESGDLVGGVQALLAPHGRGSGWGEIGGAQNRRWVADLLKDPAAHVPELSVALRAMADPRGATAVLAIPDAGPYEKEQEALLGVLRRLRPLRALLVWRPVLACLSALEDGHLDGAHLVGVISHHASGFAVQTLEIREAEGLRTPERRRPGELYPWAGGLDARLANARERFAATAGADLDPASAAQALGPIRAVLGEDAGHELLLNQFGRWKELIATSSLSSAEPVPLTEDLVAKLERCDAVLLETPAHGPARSAIGEAFDCREFPTPILLASDAVGRGGLIAARRAADGRPVYFDFLPQLSTIVQSESGHENFDLIPRDVVLPAGRIYRSTEPARLGLPASAKSVRIYLRKQDEAACRRAAITLPAPTIIDAEVRLHVEQAPAAGRARLRLESEAFAAPRVLDWDRATPHRLSWTSILSLLNRPTVPERVVLPCSLAPWFGWLDPKGLRANPRQGLAAQLTGAIGDDAQPNWKALADCIARPSFGAFALSSDGKTPSGLKPQHIEELEYVTKLAEANVRDRLDGSGPGRNDALRFLTWQFHACPEWLVEPLLDALEAGVGRHPFLQYQLSLRLILHSLGRITRTPDLQVRVFNQLLGIPDSAWERDHIACAAFLLSRTRTAAKLLSTADVRRMATIAARRTREEPSTRNSGSPPTNSYNADFFYALYLMIGLLRHRLVEPHILVAGQDRAADDCLAALDECLEDIKRRPPPINNLPNRIAVLEDCRDHLHGKGRKGTLVALSQLTGN